MSEQAVVSHDELYRAHHGQLVRLAVSYLHDEAAAEDVVHEVFTAFLTVELRDPGAAASYLWRSTKNRSVSALRKRAHLSDREVPDLVAVDPPVEQLIADSHGSTALKGLSDRQRTVLFLQHYADMSMADIAAALGVSVNTAKQHAFRGRRRLAARAAPKPIPQPSPSPCRCSTAPTSPAPADDRREARTVSKPLNLGQREQPGPALTSGELDVLHRVASGDYDDQIAKALSISTRTLRRYLTAAQRKLGARTRPHAVALAIQTDVLKREDPDTAAAAEVPATTAQTPTT